MQAYTVFDTDVEWDVPPILLNGREKLRVVAYFAKRVAKLDFEKHSVEVEHAEGGQKQVAMICTFQVTVLPESLPIPTIKLKATVKLGVSDDFQQVSSSIPIGLLCPCAHIHSHNCRQSHSRNHLQSRSHMLVS